MWTLRVFNRVAKAWKTRTDDLWKQQEAELTRLAQENDRLADLAHSWESLAQLTYRTLLRGEGEALEAIAEDDPASDERLRWEGEMRAFRKGQVAMEITGQTLGIHMHKPNN